MTPEQDRYVADLTRQLQEAHSGHQPLTPSVLRHARETIRSADSGRMELTEAEQERLDSLYGLVQWGQIALPLQRIDPAIFAKQRRARRGGDAGAAPLSGWGD
ncbi:MAG: hypothetical protein JWP41_1881 [Ramlibacter sp.]|nr:hypothetical protein [Ramlibacter sp.]